MEEPFPTPLHFLFIHVGEKDSCLSRSSCDTPFFARGGTNQDFNIPPPRRPRTPYRPLSLNDVIGLDYSKAASCSRLQRAAASVKYNILADVVPGPSDSLPRRTLGPLCSGPSCSLVHTKTRGKALARVAIVKSVNQSTPTPFHP